METNRPVTENTGRILKHHGLKPKKSLGQNFITDGRILERMIDAASIDRATGVLEIGPGIGALTERLAEVAGKVLAIEIDSRLVALLDERFRSEPRVRIETGDILAVDLHKLMTTHLQSCSRTVVVANLPYYITSAVIMRLLEINWPFSAYVFMIQKEVGERIVAKPGTKQYGVLSIAVQLYTVPEYVTRVPAHVFIPRPNVDSAVIRLTPHEQPPVDVQSVDHFFTVVRAGFKERRKTLLNNFKTHLLTRWEKADISDWLTRLGIDPNRRAETLSLTEFATISNAFSELNSAHHT